MARSYALHSTAQGILQHLPELVTLCSPSFSTSLFGESFEKSSKFLKKSFEQAPNCYVIGGFCMVLNICSALPGPFSQGGASTNRLSRNANRFPVNTAFGAPVRKTRFAANSLADRSPRSRRLPSTLSVFIYAVLYMHKLARTPLTCLCFAVSQFRPPSPSVLNNFPRLFKGLSGPRC